MADVTSLCPFVISLVLAVTVVKWRWCYSSPFRPTWLVSNKESKENKKRLDSNRCAEAKRTRSMTSAHIRTVCCLFRSHPPPRSWETFRLFSSVSFYIFLWPHRRNTGAVHGAVKMALGLQYVLAKKTVPGRLRFYNSNEYGDELG